MTPLRRILLFVVAVAVWLPTLQLVFRPPPRAALIAGLSTRQRAVALADDSAERQLLRRLNPEWDLMSRTFGVLAFTNLALAEPTKQAAHLEVADALITQTLRDERGGPLHFLLPYGRREPFRDAAQRSVFVDGEIALMLAARQLVAPRPDFAPVLASRIDEVVRQLEASPRLFAESYPDEGWTFCNSIAAAAITLSDRLDGRDHSGLVVRFLASMKAHLVEPRTGLLISSFRHDASPLDGPEGSTLWLAAHMLQVVDPDFAADQYRRARAALGHTALGFGWASEWPRALVNVDDVDSGPTVPLVDANAGSSGLALLGAGAFDDEPYLNALVTSLELAAFPARDETGLRYAAGNHLGDAVLLYALVEGPLWARARHSAAVTEARR
ncbi:MAG: hypothetical protein SFW67_28735 [Myxococcaceae bacterium]|nr:hypothetical protein [Myxococcaceae bacterium]